jgi:Rieske 2Fe-2S family protein
MSRLCGIWGRPYIDLTPVIDTSPFDAIDDEIMGALPRVEASYTGGSLKWMGVTAPWVNEDPYVDYMHVIERFSREEFVRFVSFANAEGGVGAGFDPDKRETYRFGDETDNPLSPEQMLYLKYRYGVYFPWKVCYHLLENDRWEDKHSGAGKDFTEEARRVFPRTVAFIEGLPFREIGRCVLFGIEANDHAPSHRDSEPGKALSIAQSISFCPRRDKRFYVCDPTGASKTLIGAPIYWFNDMDYHGVEPDPFFRYSIRVDGIFESDFVERLRRRHGADGARSEQQRKPC